MFLQNYRAAAVPPVLLVPPYDLLRMCDGHLVAEHLGAERSPSSGHRAQVRRRSGSLGHRDVRLDLLHPAPVASMPSTVRAAS